MKKQTLLLLAGAGAVAFFVLRSRKAATPKVKPVAGDFGFPNPWGINVGEVVKGLGFPGNIFQRNPQGVRATPAVGSNGGGRAGGGFGGGSSGGGGVGGTGGASGNPFDLISGLFGAVKGVFTGVVDTASTVGRQVVNIFDGGRPANAKTIPGKSNPARPTSVTPDGDVPGVASAVVALQELAQINRRADFGNKTDVGILSQAQALQIASLADQWNQEQELDAIFNSARTFADLSDLGAPAVDWSLPSTIDAFTMSWAGPQLA